MTDPDAKAVSPRAAMASSSSSSINGLGFLLLSCVSQESQAHPVVRAPVMAPTRKQEE
jgi:hypothetical protein